MGAILALGLLVEMFVPDGDPLIVGIDETLLPRASRVLRCIGHGGAFEGLNTI